MLEPRPADDEQAREQPDEHNPYAHDEKRVHPMTDTDRALEPTARRHRDLPVDPTGADRSAAYSVDQAEGLQDAERGGDSHYSTSDPVDPDDRTAPDIASNE